MKKKFIIILLSALLFFKVTPCKMDTMGEVLFFPVKTFVLVYSGYFFIKFVGGLVRGLTFPQAIEKIGREEIIAWSDLCKRTKRWIDKKIEEQKAEEEGENT